MQQIPQDLHSTSRGEGISTASANLTLPNQASQQNYQYPTQAYQIRTQTPISNYPQPSQGFQPVYPLSGAHSSSSYNASTPWSTTLAPLQNPNVHPPLQNSTNRNSNTTTTTSSNQYRLSLQAALRYNNNESQTSLHLT